MTFNINESEIVGHVYATTDYDQFTIIDENRDIKGIKSLKEAIDKHTWLMSPGTVNPKGELIDGQTRLTVARELGLPFHYVIDPNAKSKKATINALIGLNAARRQWRMEDWLHLYVTQNTKDESYPEYGIYSHLKEKYGFDMWSTLFLFCRTKGLAGRSVLRERFIQGEIRIDTLEKGKKFAKQIYDVEPYYHNFKRRSFIQAMIRVMNDPSYNHKRFISNLEKVRDKIYDCSSVGDYLKRIQDVMNYNQLKNRRVDFYNRWNEPDALFRVGA